jgi:hypothetical protein
MVGNNELGEKLLATEYNVAAFLPLEDEARLL